MRAWMCGRTYKFTMAHLCEALVIKPGAEHDRVYKAMQDFIQRGEVVPLRADGRCKVPLPWFAYNPTWHRMNKGVLNQRIYKAMRILSFHGPFTVADVLRATGSDDRNYIDKVTRRLAKQGHLRLVATTQLSSGGRLKYYRVIDTDRFLLEVMR